MTFTAGIQKMFHPAPRIGFLAAARNLDSQLPALRQTAETVVGTEAAPAALKAIKTNRSLHTNNLINLVVTAVFLTLAALVTAIAAYEWFRLLRGLRPPDLRETDPVWRPLDPTIPGRLNPLGAMAVSIALARNLTDQEAIDRATLRQLSTAPDPCGPRVLIDLPEVRDAVADAARAQAYVDTADKRFDGIQRCC